MWADCTQVTEFERVGKQSVFKLQLDLQSSDVLVKPHKRKSHGEKRKKDLGEQIASHDFKRADDE